jgi:hypothetical protein
MFTPIFAYVVRVPFVACFDRKGRAARLRWSPIFAETTIQLRLLMDRFTPEDREHLRNHVLSLAQSDPRITGGALVGSGAHDALDRWSDLDMTFGVVSGVEPSTVLTDHTERLASELDIVTHFDVHRGRAIYRVILFANGLELDLSVAPQDEFGQLGPSFRLLFGEAIERPDLPTPSPRDAVGWGWHHILHANSAIHRGRCWQAVFWINGLRDHVLTLVLMRHGLPAAQARGAHELSVGEAARFDDTLARSIAPDELSRALQVLAAIYIDEVSMLDRDLAEGIVGALRVRSGGDRDH